MSALRWQPELNNIPLKCQSPTLYLFWDLVSHDFTNAWKRSKRCRTNEKKGKYTHWSTPLLKRAASPACALLWHFKGWRLRNLHIVFLHNQAERATSPGVTAHTWSWEKQVEVDVFIFCYLTFASHSFIAHFHCGHALTCIIIGAIGAIWGRHWGEKKIKNDISSDILVISVNISASCPNMPCWTWIFLLVSCFYCNRKRRWIQNGADDDVSCHMLRCVIPHRRPLLVAASMFQNSKCEVSWDRSGELISADASRTSR